MEYKTKQREILLKFFSDNEDKVFSAEEISKELSGLKISQSAVYRNLNDLENHGKVKRIAKAGSRQAFYQFVDLDDCKGHLHMSCKKCGKTTHLDDKDAEILTDALKNAKFKIDNDSTILYGVCDNCDKKI